MTLTELSLILVLQKKPNPCVGYLAWFKRERRETGEHSPLSLCDPVSVLPALVRGVDRPQEGRRERPLVDVVRVASEMWTQRLIGRS